MTLKRYKIRFNLTEPVRDLMQHSAVYGFGQILSRLASLLLLPIYTRYLTPADYGVIAILDLTAAVLGTVIGSGMTAALNRYHFSTTDDAERDRVWWTGLTFVMVVSTVTLFPLFVSSRTLANLTLGPSVNSGEFFYGLVLPTLWFGVIGQLPDVYLKACKKSSLSVALSLARLLLNIALNLYYLIVLKLGIVGILLGNLITGGVTTVVLLVILSKSLGSYACHWPLIPQLWSFGSPLIITALLALIIHQSDRYFIRAFLDLNQVGIYSFAYTIGQAINALVFVPFVAIWNVVIYEIARRPDAKHVYGQIFEYFVYGLLLIMLAVSLLARQLLGLFVPNNYLPAADLIPIVCLAYLFFSLHEHFKVPVILAKRTSDLLPVFVIAVVVDTILNLVLIPRFGAVGAAWASVASFIAFSFVGLWRYRRVDKYAYPLPRCGVVLLGMIGTYLVFEKYTGSQFTYVESGAAIVLCLIWGLFLFRGIRRRTIIIEKQMIKEQSAVPVGRS